ncbi:AbrB family transcriptional regulator [Lactobacillus sp. 0.1XD8-4]|uniref:AbrB family transcriptional regulator n=1 Tax=Lactobacillus intestinalis TaxID=151781 RepID=UPI00129D6D26|nr:AbrB family transcriptional regulator [Lactobacillus intestinalis]MRN07187.1 AbrB family transcriptional regulator [Lactobacillus sp. 0.1XD8-4]
MTKALTSKMSQKAQVEIPATILFANSLKMSLQKEMEVAFEAKDALDWADLVKVIPAEDVKIDKNGQYDFLKYP